MSAMAHCFDPAFADDHAALQPPVPAERDVGVLAPRWEALQRPGAALAGLAQLGEEPPDPRIAGLPARAAAAGGWTFEMVARGAEDLAAVMQPGLRALLSLTAQGRDTTPAAMTLWREFHRSRGAILALLGEE